MATQTRNPTSEVAVTGTWSGTNRHLLLDDHPDSGNPITDGTTCSAAGTLVMGFSAFSIPAGSTGISVQVIYYDFKNASQTAANGALIRCNDTTNRLSATHNPGNGNANIALRTLNYATNPKSGSAWTVDEVNGTGTNALTAFGFSVTDASPTSTFSSAIVQVTYTPPVIGTFSGTLGALGLGGDTDVIVGGSFASSLAAATLSGAGAVSSTVAGSFAQTLSALTLSGSGAVTETVISGELNAVLSALTLEGAAVVPVAGVSDLALDVLTLNGVGTMPVGGSLDLALAQASLTGVGLAPVTGVLDVSFAALTLSGAGDSGTPGGGGGQHRAKSMHLGALLGVRLG